MAENDSNPTDAKLGLLERLIDEIHVVTQEVADELELHEATNPDPLAPLDQQMTHGREAAYLRGKAEVISRLGSLVTAKTPN